MTGKQKKRLRRIIVAFALFAVFEVLSIAGVFDLAGAPYGLALQFAAFLIPYLIAGYDVLGKAWHGITHRQPFDSAERRVIIARAFDRQIE